MLQRVNNSVRSAMSFPLMRCEEKGLELEFAFEATDLEMILLSFCLCACVFFFLRAS